MRVLITGTSGLIGQWTARELLQHGYYVRGVDRKPPPDDLRRNERIDIVYADIADSMAMMQACEGCDAVIHLAAYPQPRNVPVDEMIRVNVTGTQNILEAAMAHDIEKAVITSSVGALGFSFPKHPCLPDFLPITIDHPRRPQDIYGLTKLMNEESAAAATRLSGMTTIVFRPPGTFDMAHAIAHGWLEHMPNWKPRHMETSFWGYIDVRDAARAYRLAIESNLTGNHTFFIMADGVGVGSSLQELTEEFLPHLVGDLPKLTGKSFYDLKPAEEKFGFRAKYVWRDLLENGIPDELKNPIPGSPMGPGRF